MPMLTCFEHLIFYLHSFWEPKWLLTSLIPGSVSFFFFFISSQTQFSCQDPGVSLEDILASLPRAVPPMSGGSLSPQELTSGSRFAHVGPDDPRCNGTLRRQASPRSSKIMAGSALAAGQGEVKSCMMV